MEHAGVKIDSDVLARCRERLRTRSDRRREEIFELAGSEFNINSPQQLGDVLFNKMNLPKPMKYGKGKMISTAAGRARGTGDAQPVPRMVLEYRQLAKLKSNYVDSLAAAC